MKIKTYITLTILAVLAFVFLVQISFFMNFSRWGRKSVDKMFDTMVEQTARQITGTFDNIQDISLRITNNTDVKEGIYSLDKMTFLNKSKKIEKFMSDVISGEQRICYAAVVDNGITKFSVTQDVFEPSYLIPPYSGLVPLVLEDVKSETNKNASIFTKGYKIGDSVYLAFVSTIMPEQIDSTQHYDNLLVVLYNLGLTKTNNKILDKNSRLKVSIVDKDNIVLDSTNIDAVGKAFKESNERNILKKEEDIYKRGWKVVCEISSENVLNLVSTQNAIIITTVIISLFVVLLLGVVLVHIIQRSVSEIENGIQKISDGDLDYRLRVTNPNEIGSISKNINLMLERIVALEKHKQESQARIDIAEKMQRQAYASSLQSQISPHFLYNSMEHIKGEAQKENNIGIVNMTTVLAKSFRYSLNPSSFSTIGEDLSNAFDYFNVINLRRQIPILIECNVSSSILKIPIIRMVFQPVLENSLIHGLKYVDNGNVVIDAHETGDYIEITVSDNGVGVSETELARLQNNLEEVVWNNTENNSGHLGLINVNSRLKLYYDSSCGISVNSKEGEGFTVIIRVKKSCGEI